MKIVHVSTHDVWGGAAIAAHRLHTGLRVLGEQSTMFVAQRRGEKNGVLAFVPPMDFKSRAVRTLRRKYLAHQLNQYANSRPDGAELFSDDRSEHGNAPLNQLPSCDVLHLHWTSGFLDSESFFSLAPRNTPIVWTLHDMNAFTGGCHYDAGCGKYATGCGSCPQLGSDRDSDLSRQVWNRRRKAYAAISAARLQLAVPSQWMADKVRQSALFKQFPVTVIANGLDTDAFAPRDKGFARTVLGIPQEASVLLFAAHTLGERRKGFSFLINAIAALRNVHDLHLLAVGETSDLQNLGIPYHSLGYVSNERLLSIIYSAANLCIVPTLQDNLPNIAIESLACGTPVVGFHVGGMPDIVRDGITGLLVSPCDSEALQDGISRLLSNPEHRAEMSVHCRRIALENFSMQGQAREYAKMYASFRGQYN